MGFDRTDEEAEAAGEMPEEPPIDKNALLLAKPEDIPPEKKNGKGDPKKSNGKGSGNKEGRSKTIRSDPSGWKVLR